MKSILLIVLALVAVIAFSQTPPMPTADMMAPPAADPWAIAAWKARIDAQRAAAALIPPTTNRVYHIVKVGPVYTTSQGCTVLQRSTNLIEWVDVCSWPFGTTVTQYEDTNNLPMGFYRTMVIYLPASIITLTNTSQ